MATTYNIPIELHTTGRYTLGELKEKLMAYAKMLVSTSKTSSDVGNSVTNISKYRIIDTIDESKNSMRQIRVSEKIKALSQVPASASNTDYKDEMTDILSDKY